MEEGLVSRAELVEGAGRSAHRHNLVLGVLADIAFDDDDETIILSGKRRQVVGFLVQIDACVFTHVLKNLFLQPAIQVLPGLGRTHLLEVRMEIPFGRVREVSRAQRRKRGCRRDEQEKNDQITKNTHERDLRVCLSCLLVVPGDRKGYM